MWPALAKQGTSRQRHLTDLTFNTHQQCRLLWSAIYNQLDQYFRFVTDMLLEEVLCEPLIRSAYHVNQNMPTIHAANMIIA